MSEVIGKIHHIGETEIVGSAGTFKKRLIVIATDEQYSQQIPIDFVQDKTVILDQYKVGEDVKVSINIRGNEYNGKWYCSLNGWRIERTAASVPPSQAYVNNQQQFSPQADYSNDPDDLPF